LAVDVARLGVDALAGTGRKWLRGPRGTGFLYVRPELARELEPPVLDLHSATWTADDRYELAADATRFELWESDVAARLGLGAAGRDALAERRITVTVSSRSSTLLDMTDRGLDALVRASPHYFVSEEQLEEAAAAVSELISA